VIKGQHAADTYTDIHTRTHTHTHRGAQAQTHD